ncbi:hypothetical protein IMG5_166940 [Ichthyophthirius multifiliis]|uniref:Clusterin-associated protein 1 n=1 Tax=Ichthyophthirius multifiliis TaxID=5932 RepID=G0R0U0_ICHMU|nr:hypothetical protein IMG5_166940 [Ichthyophthirius multifiliis]EGR28900.1 hypothetical protein IMG5_166940 [Ichthyophthirius multifiliis]|eukprot:XP_004030136.1 hypothetical protein IMG5_166940 [Ichthyophthirius multifiliis]
MSYRELRNFCEIMRGLGYSRLISMENFRKPNFELIADILYWLATRFDPQADIPEDIQEERQRVEFIKQIAMLFATKTRIKLNTRKLYQADGYAVQEILKVASVLYKAYNSSPAEDEEVQAFTLPSKLSNVKLHKQVANDITDTAQKLFDLLNKEETLRSHRDKALGFLDSISRNLESNNEQAHIEKCVRQLIEQQDSGIVDMQNYVNNLQKEQKTLEEKIKKVTFELDKSSKQLQILQRMKPAYMEEYTRLEVELEKLYQIYIEKFRNLDYLEHQLDVYNQIELKNFKHSQEKRKKIREKLIEEEKKRMKGDEEFAEGSLDNKGDKNSSREVSPNPQSKQINQMKFKGTIQHTVKEEENSHEGEEDDEDVDLEDSNEQMQEDEGSDDEDF